MNDFLPFLVLSLFVVRVSLVSPKVQKRMDKATGIVLIGFGLKLALDKQH